MIEVSSLIGKPILSLATSSIIGKTADVYFDEYLKKAEYILISSTGENKAQLLPFSETQNISDAIVIADELKLKYIDDVDTSILKSGVMHIPVYTQNGALKGEISDVELNAGGKVLKLYVKNDAILPSAIAAVGDIILLKTSKAKPKPRKLTIPRPSEESPVYILETAAAQSNNSGTTEMHTTLTLPHETVAQPTVSLGTDNREPVLSNGAFELLLDGSSAYSYDEDAHTPTRVICDYAFLLGRTLGTDLCTYTGELIAKQGSEVTDVVVDRARRAGKLVELTLNSIKSVKKN